ncbi:MAG: acetylglutamate kinase [Spirochaetaceae bacterium]|nr:MAG: acetylglutamate kinase [Spirochaetaceae bacterium]
MDKPVITIKIGGKMATNQELLSDFITDVGRLSKTAHFVIIHGGGKEVSAFSEKLLGAPPVFKDGIRMTTPEEMEIVEMVLAGKINKGLVRLFQAHGIKACGISGADGGVFTGKSIGEPESQRTGEITDVKTGLIDTLLEKGYTPLVSSTTMDNTGAALNINADQAALALAAALSSRALIFLSDIPGVMKNNEVIPVLTVESAQQEIKNGTVSGGMIPKVTSSIHALDAGVKKIIIGEYDREGSLVDLLDGREGTAITH